MAVSSILLATLPASIVALSAYTAYQSYLSIDAVLTYKSKTEKAAEYSNTAEHELKQTQSTEAAGAGAVRSSLETALESR